MSTRIVPRSVERPLAPLPTAEDDDPDAQPDAVTLARARVSSMSPAELALTLGKLRAEMKEAADRLEFEEAAALRDRVRSYEGIALGLHDDVSGRGR